MKRFIDELRLAGLTGTDLTISGANAELLMSVVDEAHDVTSHNPSHDSIDRLREALRKISSTTATK